MMRGTTFFTFSDDAVAGGGQDGDGGGAAAGRPRQSEVDLPSERVIAIGTLRGLKENWITMLWIIREYPPNYKVGQEVRRGPELHAVRFSQSGAIVCL